MRKWDAKDGREFIRFFFVSKPKRKKQLGRLRRRKADNVTAQIKHVNLHQVTDRRPGSDETIVNQRVLKNVGKVKLHLSGIWLSGIPIILSAWSFG